MPKKLYIKESTTKDSDGEELLVVQAYESEVKNFNYLVWLKT